MTSFDDPNRQAVGLDPIWSGEHDTGDGGFDPGEHTVADVEAYVAAHPDERAAVLAAEQAGKNRTTLVAALSEEPAEGG